MILYIGMTLNFGRRAEVIAVFCAAAVPLHAVSAVVKSSCKYTQ